MGKILSGRGGASRAVLVVLALGVLNACGGAGATQKRAVRAEAAAASTAPAAPARPSPAADALRGVWRRILAASRPEERPTAYQWPPVLIGPDAEEIARFNTMITAAKGPSWAVPADETNAYAAFLPYSTLSEHQFLPPPRGSGAARARRAAANVPFVVVAPALYSRFLTTSAGEINPDRAAFLLGHELSHILKAHISTNVGISVEARATSRTQELDADVGGMTLALGAGFSKENGQRLYQALEEDLSYSSIEGQALTHPSHRERLEMLDTKQRELWRGMVDFDNGVFLLTVEQYDPAAKAFESVLREFPGSYESWANLGYAQLMKYCDALEPKDLIALNLGPLVVGTFYERPDSLMAMVKGFDGPLWDKAVSSLQRALAEAERARANTALIKANLAVAFLVKEGRTADDVARARAFFADALSPASASALRDMNRAAVLINAGAADMAGDKPADALVKFDAVRGLGWWGSLDNQAFNSPYQQIGKALLSAECFNRRLAVRSLARTPDETAEATAGLCQCVRVSPSASHWQQVLLGHLAGSGDSSMRECMSFTPPPVRMVVSATVLPNVDVQLGDRMREVEEKLAALRVNYEVVGRELKRIDAASSGFEVLGSAEVIGIVFKDANALPVRVRDRAPGSPFRELRVGMRQTLVEQVLGTAQGGTIYSTDTSGEYRFYPYAGLAFKYNTAGRVARLVVVQAPRRG